jgi:predicted dehydrogenase
MLDLNQSWLAPAHPRPIVIIGAGGIVRTAHLPVYRRLGFPVAGVFDIRPDAARETASAFGVNTVFDSIGAAAQTPDAVFDLAVPADQIATVLAHLPAGAPVLIQKPMGESLDQAREILTVCRGRRLTAAINFQLRFSPHVLALRDFITRGSLGDILDIEVRLVTNQPWQLWEFLKKTRGVEVLYHSVHYLDTIRLLAGEPTGVYCKGVRHPDYPEFRETRSSIILDYGDRIRCSLSLNHTHRCGPRCETSMLKVEGSRGAAVLRMGVNLDYPTGQPDALDVVERGGDWQSVPLRGSWFIEAFEGPMSNLQRFVAGEDAALVSPVEDAVKTMALVEACYESSARGATPIAGVEG